MEKLKNGAETLYIPLEARIFVSKEFPDYFRDEKALSMEKYLPFRSPKKKFSEYLFLASVARHHNMDFMVKVFAADNGSCNIVALGVGLDTAGFRLKELDAQFYCVDLPEVIELRKEIVGQGENEVLIGCDMFSMEWAKSIDCRRPTMIIASGVLQFFPEEKVLRLVSSLKSTFDTAELVFDTTNVEGAKLANRHVDKSGREDARILFCVEDGKAFANKSQTTLMEQRLFFGEARSVLKKRLSFYSRIAMKKTDDKRMLTIVHVKLRD